MEGIGQAPLGSATGATGPSGTPGPSGVGSQAPASAPATYAPVAPERRGEDAFDTPSRGGQPRLDGAPAFESPVRQQALDVALRGALGREPSLVERDVYGDLYSAMQGAGKSDAQIASFIQDASARTREVVDEVVRQELGLVPDFFRLPEGGAFHAAAVAMLHERPGQGLDQLGDAIRAKVQEQPEWKLKRPGEWARRVAQRVTGNAADGAGLEKEVAARLKTLLSDKTASRRDVAAQIEAELSERLAPSARAA